MWYIMILSNKYLDSCNEEFSKMWYIMKLISSSCIDKEHSKMRYKMNLSNGNLGSYIDKEHSQKKELKENHI